MTQAPLPAHLERAEDSEPGTPSLEDGSKGPRSPVSVPERTRGTGLRGVSGGRGVQVASGADCGLVRVAGLVKWKFL